MAIRTGIEWTDATWNPVSGCTKVSPGCANCYAERLVHHRFHTAPAFLPGQAEIHFHPERLTIPLRWQRASTPTPKRVFVCSMGDLFHEAVPFSFLQDVFEVMRLAPEITFQVLTKRHDQLRLLAKHLEWPANVWCGVSAETQHWLCLRMAGLKEVPAHTLFLSLEPLLGPLELKRACEDLAFVPSWVIVGGESGPGHRRMDPDWVQKVWSDTQEMTVPFFFKQWGGFRSRRRESYDFTEIRQFPGK